MANAPATSFESILDTPAGEIERPKPLPAGTYDAIVKGLPEFGESSQKKTPFCRFTYAIQAAGEDVDEEELQAIGGLDGKTIRDTYYTTPDAIFRLTETMERMGVDPEGKTVRQMIDETPNSSIRLVIGHRSSEDGQQIFAEVKRTMKAD
jgi:hypothetical protein